MARLRQGLTQGTNRHARRLFVKITIFVKTPPRRAVFFCSGAFAIHEKFISVLSRIYFFENKHRKNTSRADFFRNREKNTFYRLTNLTF